MSLQPGKPRALGTTVLQPSAIDDQRSAEIVDCLIVGGGPAGLTAGLYLARFRRSFLLVDAGASRAESIPTSHNIPVFAEGISGAEILARQRSHLARYGVAPLQAVVDTLNEDSGHFLAGITGPATPRWVRARHVLLATGSEDVEPDLPDLPNAVQRGLVRYCPICDGFEAQSKRIAVVGYGSHGLGEAVFIARTYSREVTLLTLGQPMTLDPDQSRDIEKHGIKVIRDPIESLEIDGDRIAAVRAGGVELTFDVIYSALGLKRRTQLGIALGAEHDAAGGLVVDEHNQTSVSRLFAAGGAVHGLDQIVVAMGQAAVAAVSIHNRCELPTEQEPESA